jgi:hypothetical protein
MGSTVELILNLVGMLVALGIVCLWLRWAPHGGFDRKTQFIALALLILILFPVISVTDDLLAAQNPAETESCVRRDQIVSSIHPAPPPITLPLEDLLVAYHFGFLRFAAPGARPVAMVSAPAMAPIENRPPPLA